MRQVMQKVEKIKKKSTASPKIEKNQKKRDFERIVKSHWNPTESQGNFQKSLESHESHTNPRKVHLTINFFIT